ncbi:MAG: anti-sigma factor family protein [Dysosmobacter welbionis]
MKVSCDVIRDLLPLYTDQAASADTVALVEEHLASCPACREELGRLGTALPAEPEVEPCGASSGGGGGGRSSSP